MNAFLMGAIGVNDGICQKTGKYLPLNLIHGRVTPMLLFPLDIEQEQ